MKYTMTLKQLMVNPLKHLVALKTVDQLLATYLAMIAGLIVVLILLLTLLVPSAHANTNRSAGAEQAQFLPFEFKYFASNMGSFLSDANGTIWARSGWKESGLFTPDSQLNLTQKDKELSVKFSVLDYASPEDNRYSNHLEGYDPRWKEV